MYNQDDMEYRVKRGLRRFMNHPFTEVFIMMMIIASVMLVLYEFSIGV